MRKIENKSSLLMQQRLNANVYETSTAKVRAKGDNMCLKNVFC